MSCVDGAFDKNFLTLLQYEAEHLICLKIDNEIEFSSAAQQKSCRALNRGEAGGFPGTEFKLECRVGLSVH